MYDNINLELKNIGPINKANLNISKINVIGGKNSTGKSTSSKIFYSLLKINTPQRLINTRDNLYNNIYLLLDDLKQRTSIKLKTPIIKHLNVLSKRAEEYKNDDDLIRLINLYYELKGFYSLLSQCNDIDVSDLANNFEKLDKYINQVLDDSKEAYTSFLSNILKSELNITIDKPFDGFINLYGEFEGSEFSFPMDFNSYECNPNGHFAVREVHYIDSFSIFDREDEGLFNTGHVAELSNNLKDTSEAKEFSEDIINKDIINIEDKINKLINGNLKIDDGNIIYEPEENLNISMKGTASGIKQIGIIQLLLANRKLKKGDFLIIDEPEVNLHPEWQLKFAEILVLLAKDLDITIYINTHSPMFIESIDTFAEFHDLESETRFYLTEKSEESTAYDMINIDSDELYIIYDNLGDPYDDLDSLRLSKGRE